MNAPTNKTRSILIATLLLGLGASALADGGAPIPPTSIQPTAPQTAAPGVTLQAQPAPTARPTPPSPGQAGAPDQHGPRGGHGPRSAGPGQMAPCAPGAGMAMRPTPVDPTNPGRARPTPPASGTALPTTPGTTSAQPAAPKAPKGDKMDQGLGKGNKGEVCPPAPRGMEQGQPQPGAAAPGQSSLNPAPAARDLSRLDRLTAQTSDSRIRGYLNDARTYLQSASKAQQKAGRDLLHAAEALVNGIQTP